LRKFGQAAEVKSGCVYIMASGRNGTLYIGVTSDLPKRAWEHRNGVVPGFTRKYGCKLLVWYAAFEDLQQARLRELQMKKWKRLWKLSEIEQMNPDGKDLYPPRGEGP
jgi:putative endonuclease